MKRVCMLAVLVLSVAVMAWAQAASPSVSNGAWIDLGSLGSGNSIATAVSGDGSVVTGISSATGGLGGQYDRGFIWTQGAGMQDLDGNPNDGVIVRPYAISADGSMIAGYFAHYPECNPSCAFQWTSYGGFATFGAPSGWYGPSAAGLSKDGGVMAGTASIYCPPCGSAGWLFTGIGGFVGVGTLPGGASWVTVTAVSEDGKVVVGGATDAQNYNQAFRWTQDGGIVGLGFLPGGNYSQATGASTDGSVIAGWANTNVNCPPGLSTCNVPFRWTQAGMAPLPILAGKVGAVTTGVSADGKTIVGYAATNCCDWEAWRWSKGTGTQSINDWLTDVGVPATDVSFYSAYAVNANGTGVVGQLGTGDAYLALVTVNRTATPTYLPAAGLYTDAIQVTISDLAPGAAIYYTTDGSTPTTGSTPYTEPITVSANTTLKSIAVVTGYAKSGVATASYKIRAATPTYLPPPGTYKGQQQVTISDITPGVTIHYTTDRSTPTTSSPVYTGPITVTKGTTVLKSIAVASNYAQSLVASGVYRIQ